ncbi:MAG: hypothetical protein JWP97_3712 [Labilithrix sp.]|nr:hypothetical protein [Labilithrix sp.]
MVVSRLARLALAALLAVALLACGCSKKEAEPAVELPTVTETTPGLLFTWIDDKGEFHVEEKPSAVPEASRETVKVRDPARDALPSDRIFVADLRNAGPNGAYPVKMVPGGEFEDIAVTRRAKHGLTLSPREAGAIPEPERPAVIIYGASWCGPCHQAAAFLKGKGVAFVEHDIEQDHDAAREMKAKLQKAGARGGSIPVLDVKGKILIGFDARAVEQALAM